MKILQLRAALIFALTLNAIGSIYALQTDQTQWSAVTAGATLCNPVFSGNYLYTLSSDQALNCINTAGSFVWRRTVERVSKPLLAATRSGVLVIADAAGKVQAVSGQGLYLWSLKLKEPVLFEPYSAADGRIYILTRSSLYCISIKGKIRWRLRLSAAPARQLCETGSAGFVLSLTNREFLTISAAGELLSTRSVKKGLTVLVSAADGYIIGSGDGELSYYRMTAAASPQTATDTVQHTEEQPVWQLQAGSPLFVHVFGKELFCAYADGTVQLRSALDGSLLYRIAFSSVLTMPLYCIKTDGEYYLACKGFAGAIGSSGTIKRQERIPVTPFMPVITPSGILIAVEDWVINSWRFDTKIMQGEPQQEPAPQYARPSWGNNQQRSAAGQGTSPQSIPFFIPYGDTEALLNRIEASILQGTAYPQETADVAVLEAVLMDTKRSAVLPYDFTVHEQARAAELLGKYESLEYRSILLEAARQSVEPVVAVGIIRGLGHITADPDGKSMHAIQVLLKRCGTQQPEPGYAACDALAEMAKYGDKTAADTAIKILFAITASAYPENLRQYTRQKIKTIVN